MVTANILALRRNALSFSLLSMMLHSHVLHKDVSVNGRLNKDSVRPFSLDVQWTIPCRFVYVPHHRVVMCHINKIAYGNIPQIYPCH